MGLFPKSSLEMFWCCYPGDEYEKEIRPHNLSPYFCITHISEVIHCFLSETYNTRMELHTFHWSPSLTPEKNMMSWATYIPNLSLLLSDLGKRFDASAWISPSENLGGEDKGECRQVGDTTFVLYLGSNCKLPTIMYILFYALYKSQMWNSLWWWLF